MIGCVTLTNRQLTVGVLLCASHFVCHYRHTVHIRSIDAASNPSHATNFTFVVTNADPESIVKTTVESGPPSPCGWGAAYFQTGVGLVLNHTDVDTDVLAAGVSYEARFQGSDWLPVCGGRAACVHHVTGLTPGLYEIQMRAKLGPVRVGVVYLCMKWAGVGCG